MWFVGASGAWGWPAAATVTADAWSRCCLLPEPTRPLQRQRLPKLPPRLRRRRRQRAVSAAVAVRPAPPVRHPPSFLPPFMPALACHCLLTGCGTTPLRRSGGVVHAGGVTPHPSPPARWCVGGSRWGIWVVGPPPRSSRSTPTPPPPPRHHAKEALLTVHRSPRESNGTRDPPIDSVPERGKKGDDNPIMQRRGSVVATDTKALGAAAAALPVS